MTRLIFITSKTHSLRDDFLDNSLNGLLWSIVASGGYFYTETGGRARVGTANNTGDGRIRSNGYYDLTSSSVTVDIATPVGTTNNPYQYLRAELDANNYLEIRKVGPNLVTNRVTGGVTTQLSTIAWNAVAHFTWRLREAGGQILYEASPDGYQWDLLATTAPTFAVNRMQVSIGAGSGTAGVVTAEFDNVNIPPLPDVTPAIPILDVVRAYAKF